MPKEKWTLHYYKNEYRSTKIITDNERLITCVGIYLGAPAQDVRRMLKDVRETKMPSCHWQRDGSDYKLQLEVAITP